MSVEKIKTDEKKADLKKKGLKFEEEHGKFLSELKNMPKRTKEEKKARWDFFQLYSAKEDFVVGVWMASHENTYKRLREQLEERYSNSFEQDTGIASVEKKKEIDPLVFQEAIKAAIETYTGINSKGEEYVFVACVGQRYRQLAGEEAGKKAQEEREGVTRSRWKRRELGRFIKAVNKTYEILYPQESKSVNSLKETVEYILDGATKYTITKADKDFVIKYVMGKNRLVSLEEEINGEEKRTWKDDYQTVMNGVVPFFKDIEDNWEDMRAFNDLKEQTICKMFLTKDVLLVLKTDEKMHPYTEVPACNESAYLYFQPWGRFLYERVFYEKYLCRAFMEKPRDFDETSKQVLRDDFNFSDDLLAEVEGKNRATIWRYRKHYKKCMEFFL